MCSGASGNSEHYSNPLQRSLNTYDYCQLLFRVSTRGTLSLNPQPYILNLYYPQPSSACYFPNPQTFEPATRPSPGLCKFRSSSLGSFRTFGHDPLHPATFLLQAFGFTEIMSGLHPTLNPKPLHPKAFVRLDTEPLNLGLKLPRACGFLTAYRVSRVQGVYKP